MHYYKRNIGDYHKKAGRLSILQHGVYALLIDAIYDREKFPSLDEAVDWVWASTEEEVSAVGFVLKKFFEFEDGVYVQNRISEEIQRYQENSATNKRIAIEREAKRREKSTKREQSVNEAPPNHKPITNNQEPVTKLKDKSTKADQIPYKKIAELYNEVCTNLPKVLKPENLNDKRKRAIKKFWNNHSDNQNSQFFADYFYLANQDQFFCGFNNNDAHSTWRADIEFLMRIDTYDKFMERQQHA
jgi:uncharacterized protein YdaU (DUF1376 family)